MGHGPNKVRLPQGAILRAIVRVLVAHPDGLRAVEIRKHVDQELGRGIGKSAINDRLWRNGQFERVRRGVYKLKD
jgi:hypothetical protein